MLFTQTAHLREIERLMQMVPRFKPRGHGIYIPKEITRTVSGTREQLLSDALSNIRHPAFIKRLNQYLKESEECPMDYRNEKHRIAFTEAVEKLNRRNFALMAALYLLTADHRLWIAAKRYTERNVIRINSIKLRDCSVNAYSVAVIDLRNPTKSDGNNLLHLVNKYMDASKKHPDNLGLRAKAEKYAKIIAKTLIYNDGDASAYGQNAFFYDAAEGLMTAVILLIAEYAPPAQRHIVSVFKLIQDLLAPSGVKGKNQFQLLMERLPPEHKARWFAGAALNTSDQAMASVMSTAMSRLNALTGCAQESFMNSNRLIPISATTL